MPHRHYKPGARIFVRSTSFGYKPKKLLRKKKNESWTMECRQWRPNKSNSRSWRKLVMRNRPVWFVQGSAGVPRAGFGVTPKRSFFNAKISGRGIATTKVRDREARSPARETRALPNQVHCARHVRANRLLRAGSLADTFTGEAEVEQVVVSATRFDIPLDQSPASVSVISSEDLEQKQIERVSDALREVPGLSVVQTGTAGQLTSVFTAWLPSEHTQVLLDGIPINQGLPAHLILRT